MLWLVRAAENLNSVNFNPALIWGWLSLTLFSGLFFWLLVWLNRKTLTLKKFFLILIIAWLPLAANFFYNLYLTIKEDINWLKIDQDERRQLALCQISRASGLNETLCGLNDFVEAVKQTVPAGASIQLAAEPGLKSYFYYDLIPTYRIVVADLVRADYFLVYAPPESYVYADRTLYRQLPSQDGNEIREKIGDYDLIKQVAPRQFILKRL